MMTHEKLEKRSECAQTLVQAMKLAEMGMDAIMRYDHDNALLYLRQSEGKLAETRVRILEAKELVGC